MELQRKTSSVVITMASVVVAVVVAILSQLFVFSTYHVPSGSMMPTIMPGDAVIVSGPLWDQLDPDPTIQRGDMIVFSDEQGWLTGTPDPNAYLTKRIIGLPGDRITQDKNGHLYINGERYTDPTAHQPAPQTPYSVTVPEGKLWVLGDNRQNSADSRYHHQVDQTGFVDISSVEGTVRGVLPLHKINPPPFTGD